MNWSVSDSNDFKLCPRLFYYKKVLGYDLIAKPKHLMLGDAYDKLLEVWDREGFTVALGKIDKLFNDAHDAAEAEIILEVYNDNYQDDRLPPIDENGNQHGFGIEIGPCKFTGYIDKISQKEISGLNWHVIVERKTTSDPIEDESRYWNRLDLDPQIRGYVAYAKSRGWNAGWVCYEVIRKFSSTYHKSLNKKKEIPIDEYRSLLRSLDLNKKLVNRKWFFVSQDMIDEFLHEQAQSFGMFQTIANNLSDNFVEKERDFIKHEKSCDMYGGCPYLSVCKKEISIQDCIHLKKERGKFNAD